MTSKASRKALPQEEAQATDPVDPELAESATEKDESLEGELVDEQTEQPAKEESAGPDLDPSALEDRVAKDALDTSTEPDEAPIKDFIVLNGPASFGPVVIGGQSVRCKKDVLYQVADVAERATILGTGRFRSATKKDQARAGRPSAGPGGAVTRDLLPPGALKGGVMQS
ncbi:MAG: hypothetical protein JXA87_07890 [Thermoleophilia bacterium]|nr:hypothetical protein [Thermoleophilia bacterium]